MRGRSASNRRGGVLAAWTVMVLGAAAGVGAAESPAAVYVANNESKGLSQYSAGADGRLTALTPASVATGTGPAAVAVTPDGKSVYVVNQGSGSVSQYDVGAGGALSAKSPATVEATIGIDQIAVGPDGRSAYVSAYSGYVYQYEIADGGLLKPMSPATVAAGGEGTEGIAINPDGRSAYVANELGNVLLEYDIGAGGRLTPKPAVSVTGGNHPVSVGITPDGRNVYASDFLGAGVEEYDVGPTGVLATKGSPSIGAGENPYGLAVSPDGASVYVANIFGRSVSQYDVGPGGELAAKVSPTIAAGGKAFGITMSPGGSALYTTLIELEGVAQFAVGAGGLLSADSPPVASSEKFPGAVVAAPDQGPRAAFEASVMPVGSATVLNGSASSDPDGSVARYLWDFGDGKTATGSAASVSHTYATPGARTVTLRVVDNEGCSVGEVFTGQSAYCNASPAAITNRTIIVAPEPAPLLTALRESATRWRLGAALARVSSHGHHARRPPVGTTFSFSLDRRASVSFQFTRLVSGHSRGHTCLAGAPRHGHGRACTLSVLAGAISDAAHAGAGKVVFQGRISRTVRLRPGRYLVLVSASGAGGAHLPAQSLKFTIVR